MPINNFEELNLRRAQAVASLRTVKNQVIVCGGTGCVSNGSLEVYQEFRQQIEAAGLPVQFILEKHENAPPSPDSTTYAHISGCHGFCQMGPLVHILPEDILYCTVKVSDVSKIIQTTLIEGKMVERLLFKDPQSNQPKSGYQTIPFYAGQNRRVLRRCGHVDPESLEAYLASDGFLALEKALKTMTPAEVRAEIKASGLRGRGGAGFPTGVKWDLCASAIGDEKYIICNGDEGDPGAFMDRSIMEGDPFAVLEGVILASYAVGARKAYLYVREEYPLAVKRLTKAIQMLYAEKLLGKNILGTGLDCDIEIVRGAGAFVCGEETALIQSIEGKRGMPRARPPYPAEAGLFGKPTVINNVETFANVESILVKGAKWFNSVGTETSKGSKVFALTGKINSTGLVEVAMGTTIRQIVFDIGGGIPNGKKVKAVQIGGPSGGCVSSEYLDLPIDYESLKEVGSMMGSGGMVVMDEDTCVVDIAKYFIHFCAEESCGKCVPCREGTQQLEVLLTKIASGQGEPSDLEKIEELCQIVESTSLCGLGKSAVNPVKSTLRYFRDEYLAHITDKRCPAGVCKALITYIINDLCTGCMLCLRNCPVNAISGEKKQKHVIDPEICTRCGACYMVCNFNAIEIN